MNKTKSAEAKLKARLRPQKDPDEGLELTDWIKKRLRTPIKRLIPWAEIKRKYNLR